MPDQCVWEKSIGTSIWTNRLVGLCCFCLSFLCCCLTLSFSCVCETSGNHVLNGGNNSFLGCHFFRTRHISFGEIDKNGRSGLVFFCVRALLCIRTWSRRDTLLNQMGIGVWCVHRWCRSMYSLILHDCRDSMVRLRPMMVQTKRLWCRRWSFCLSLRLWQSSKKRRPLEIGLWSRLWFTAPATAQSQLCQPFSSYPNCNLDIWRECSLPIEFCRKLLYLNGDPVMQSFCCVDR